MGVAAAFVYAAAHRERYADFFEADGSLVGPGYTDAEAAGPARTSTGSRASSPARLSAGPRRVPMGTRPSRPEIATWWYAGLRTHPETPIA